MQHPQPWFRKSQQAWYLTLRGRQYNLGRDREAAFQEYHRLMSAPEPIRHELVLGILDAYLGWCQQHRKPATFEWYQAHLQSFARSLADPEAMTVEELKPYHLQTWADAHPGWGPTMRRNSITAVQRAFNWAVKLGHLTINPVGHVKKPQADRREQIISTDEYRAITGAIRDRYFRDVIEFSWETGARPQETRIIEARHVNLERSRVEIPPAEAKGGKRWRIIYLTETAASIVRRLALKYPKGPIFRNADGYPWTAEAFNCRFCRLKGKLGTKYAMYSFRHTFANRLLMAGADALTVSALLGHKDGATLARVYSHLAQNADFLREELRRVLG